MTDPPAFTVLDALATATPETPIFGMALGMLQGRPKLVMDAFSAEVLGVILAVGAGVLIGMFDVFNTEATPKMISRTSPNLIDLLLFVGMGALFVASFCVVSGNRALVPLKDPRLHEALNYDNP